MVLVAGYLVTTQRSFFSSPPLQPITFVILSSFLSISYLFFCLHRSCYFPFSVLYFSLTCFFLVFLMRCSPFFHIFFLAIPLFPLSRAPSLFSAWLPASTKVFSFPQLPLSLPLSSPSSHFHAAGWAATLRVFIAVWARGGGLLPGTNGLLENTDSHASQSAEPREREREREAKRGRGGIWS